MGHSFEGFGIASWTWHWDGGSGQEALPGSIDYKHVHSIKKRSFRTVNAVNQYGVESRSGHTFDMTIAEIKLPEVDRAMILF